MTITYKDYKIHAQREQYILYKTTTIKSGKNEGVEKEIEYGYFSGFENCLKKIIQMELAEKNEEVSILGYISMYRKMKEEITNILK